MIGKYHHMAKIKISQKCIKKLNSELPNKFLLKHFKNEWFLSFIISTKSESITLLEN